MHVEASPVLQAGFANGLAGPTWKGLHPVICICVCSMRIVFYTQLHCNVSFKKVSSWSKVSVSVRIRVFWFRRATIFIIPKSKRNVYFHVLKPTWHWTHNKNWLKYTMSKHKCYVLFYMLRIVLVQFTRCEIWFNIWVTWPCEFTLLTCFMNCLAHPTLSVCF